MKQLNLNFKNWESLFFQRIYTKIVEEKEQERKARIARRGVVGSDRCVRQCCFTNCKMLQSKNINIHKLHANQTYKLFELVFTLHELIQ